MKTREEVEKLKRDWHYDPCWDISETKDFEEYREELKAYQEKCWQEAKEKTRKQGEEEKAEAEKLGLYGLYKRIKELEKLENRHYMAIAYLAEGKPTLAHKALLGRDE